MDPHDAEEGPCFVGVLFWVEGICIIVGGRGQEQAVSRTMVEGMNSEELVWDILQT
jgi:hypothetical protein